MKRTFKPVTRASERGAVAVEAAFVLGILATFLALPSIFLAIYFYTYTAAQKAIHDAALYLSTAPKMEMTTAGPDGDPAAMTVARKLIAKEMAGVLPDGVSLEPSIVCGYRQPPGNVVPKLCTLANNQAGSQTLFQLTVSMELSFVDPLTGSDSGLWILPYAPVRYVGN
jgi:hypothetical protein